jgi:transcriptional regulator with XRE-family HTH domain
MKFLDLVEKFKSDRKDYPTYLRDGENFQFEISSLITEARIHSGLTQKELSVLVGTGQPSIARWEAAVSLPSLRTLKKIADALNTYLVPPRFGFMEDELKNVRIHVTLSTQNISQALSIQPSNGYTNFSYNHFPSLAGGSTGNAMNV